MKPSFDYADGIYLLPDRVTDLDRMALHLEREANRVGLNINTNTQMISVWHLARNSSREGIKGAKMEEKLTLKNLKTE